MLLIILWSIVATLAVAQGMLVLFLIRSRGHVLSLSGEILKLQRSVQRQNTTLSTLVTLSARLTALEEHMEASKDDVNTDEMGEGTGQIIHLAAVGGRR